MSGGAVMAAGGLLLSPKYRAFLRCDAAVEFLEGTTAAGKTTVGVAKFMLRAMASPRKTHVLSGLDVGTIEKNIINKELGVLDLFGGLVRYHPRGKGAHSLPHLACETVRGEKIIYVLGYDNKNRWKKALGGQYGCVYIDEINIADMEYVREVFMRGEYVLATLNPDDPGLPVYEEYIDHARPLPEWRQETPPELLRMLAREEHEGWVHWFFDFGHNPALGEEKRARMIAGAPVGTKLYKNKILGLRGRAAGLVFDVRAENVIPLEQAQQYEYRLFTAGLDTAYSQASDDSFALVFGGVTRCGRYVALACASYNNRELESPLSPSDIPPLLVQFCEAQREVWGLARDIFIDSADAATLAECRKYKQRSGCVYNFVPAWKKTRVIDRIHMQIGWMAKGEYLISGVCRGYVDEMNRYSWRSDEYAPEDANDHLINAAQYSWLPFVRWIGREV